MIEDVGYFNHGNVFVWRLYSDVDGQVRPVDLSAVTRVVVVVDGSLSVDSDVHDVLDWEIGSVPVTDPDCGKMVVALGGSGLVPIGTYAGVRVVVYDQSNPSGVVWADDLRIAIR